MAKHVYGNIVDDETRCVHYHTEIDIIAIKFKCCNKYYPCYKCHDENENHDIITWPEHEWHEKAILCGICKEELSIRDYMANTHCPKCGSMFNSRCQNHYHLYFDMPK